MSLKQNIGYSYLLTVANYIFPLIVFPYVTRVLGAENIGICNWVDSIIQYFVKFSLLGISVLGVREIAYGKNDPDKLSNVFSSLLCINFIMTLLTVVVLYVCIFTIPSFYEYKALFYIGSAQLLTNLFLIEWFYKGVENFKYITIRSVVVKTIYALAIFLVIRDASDYKTYYTLTVLSVAVNAAINIWHARKFVRIKMPTLVKQFTKPFIILGLYVILTSLYSTFNVAYLGIVHNKVQVGYYTTAVKIFGFILAFYTTWTTVLMPRISSLISTNERQKAAEILTQSLNLLYSVAFPLAVVGVSFAPEIIDIIGGKEFCAAVPLLRVTMPLLIVIGVEQVLVVQLLMPFKADKEVLINSIVSAVVGVCVGLVLVKQYAAMGTAMTWILIELIVLGCSIFFARKYIKLKLLTPQFWKNVVCSVAYFGIFMAFRAIIPNHIVLVVVSAAFTVISFVAVQKYFIKDEIIDECMVKLVQKLRVNKQSEE